MKEPTIEENLEEYPYLKDMANKIIYISKEDYELLKNGEYITITNEDVSIEFLKRILNNDYYFEYALRYLNGDIDYFCVGYISFGDPLEICKYRKATIIRAMEQLIKNGKLVLNQNELEKLRILKETISFNKFIQKHEGNNYNIDIDGNHYSIPIKDLLTFIQLPSEQFNNICTNDNIKNINGINKKHFAYATCKFLIENDALYGYLIPLKLYKRCLNIKASKILDIEALNKHITTPDKLYKDIKINQTLEGAILSGMPEDATDLEKAIFIYIKMCKLLTYDEEFFAVNQKGEAAEKHKSIEHISSITLDNNKAVCFEFNIMYSYFLSKLGLNFSSDYSNSTGENYGSVHANLEFRTDKFLVSADSVTGILQGDMMQAKLNQPLVGLKCLNANKQTQQEFKEATSRMYKIIVSQNKDLNNGINNDKIEHIQSLDELLEEYSKVTDNIQDISLNERLSILINKVNSTGLVGVDSLSYILQLRKILFTEEQRKNNIKITILRNNEPIDKDTVAMASAIFVLNDQTFEDNPNQNIYYYFNPNHELVPITKEELQSRFDNGLLEYIEKDDPRIPGIIERGEMIK